MKEILLRIKEFLKDWSETFKNWAEVIAFVGAAWWAVHTYLESVRPDRQIRVNTTSKLELSQFKPGVCEADFTVTVENLSKAPLRMSYIQLEAFKLDTSKIANGMYLDDQEFVRMAEKFDGRQVQSGAFGGYPLNTKNGGTYSWFITEQPNTAVGFAATIQAKDFAEPVAYEMQWNTLNCKAAETEASIVSPHKSRKKK